MIGTAEQDAFISNSKWAVVTTLRRDGSPSSSVVFYVRDGDEILFSTTVDRLKAKSLRRDPRIAVTVLDDGAPYGYVTVEGTAVFVDRDVRAHSERIYRSFRGPEWSPPADFAEQLAAEGRVVVHVTPQRVSGVIRRRR